MHDIQNGDTGPDAAFDRDNRRSTSPTRTDRSLPRHGAFELRAGDVVHQPAESHYLHRSTRSRELRDRERPGRWCHEKSHYVTYGCRTVGHRRCAPMPSSARRSSIRCGRTESAQIQAGVAKAVSILPTVWHAANLGFFVAVSRECVGPMNRPRHADLSTPPRVTTEPIAKPTVTDLAKFLERGAANNLPGPLDAGIGSAVGWGAGHVMNIGSSA
jgi:hypothetical protein